jgi:hypothetical protein
MLLIRGLAIPAMIAALLVVSSCQTTRPPSTKRPDEKLAPAMDKTKVSGKAGHGTLEFRLGYYNNEDSPGDGNPFLDEQLTVIEPIIYYDYNTTDDTAWWTMLTYDSVSSASIERINDYPGSEQSGASGDYYIGVDIGRRHQSSDYRRHDVWLHGSAEYDYRSFGIGGSVGWDSSDRNQTTKISGNIFFDDLDLIRFNGLEDGSDNRLSGTLGLTRYQVMTDRMHAEIGATLTYQEGFLGSPFNGVVLEDGATVPPVPFHNNALGVEIAERLPDTRIRGAVHGRIRRQFGENTALEFGGRLYADDWGVVSVTLEPKVYYWLVKDKLRGRFRYRYYTQTAADDFEEHFAPADASRDFLTQDSDLGDFDSHTLGFGLTWDYDPGLTYHFAADYVARGDGIDQLFASVGMTWSF